MMKRILVTAFFLGNVSLKTDGFGIPASSRLVRSSLSQTRIRSRSSATRIKAAAAEEEEEEEGGTVSPDDYDLPPPANDDDGEEQYTIDSKSDLKQKPPPNSNENCINLPHRTIADSARRPRRRRKLMILFGGWRH